MNKKFEGNLIKKSPSAQTGKPAGLPDKFWNEETGQVNLEALIEDYNYMASRDDNLVEIHNRNMPESYDKYEVNFPHPLLDRDDEIFKRFYEKGFTKTGSNAISALRKNLAKSAVRFPFGQKETCKPMFMRLWAQPRMALLPCIR